MSSTQTESRNGTETSSDVRKEIEELKKTIEVQAATQAGVEATQTATMAGAQATQAAAHAGTWSTMVAGSVGLVVGLFMALAFAATTRS
jgi:ElaB/YqjD/DUF883 family membrane-anchored ribosome-binding protein